MNEQAVQAFWELHQCGDAQIGGLREGFESDYEAFFADYDRFRYQNERHLRTCVDALNVAGKQVLEIGLGQGSESERLIRNGALWSGVDLTAESVYRVQARLTLRELPYEQLRQGTCSIFHSPMTERDPQGATPRRGARDHDVRPLVAELPGVHQSCPARCLARNFPAC